MESPEAIRKFLEEYKKYAENILVPTRNEIKTIFNKWKATGHWESAVEKENLPRPSPVQTVYSRIKRPESVADKIIRKQDKYSEGLSLESVSKMTDTIGVRVIAYFLSQLPLVHREIYKQDIFEISEIDPPIAYMNLDLATRLSLLDIKQVDRESGYVSVHYIVRLRESKIALSERPWFEIQLRTLTENTWGEIEHILGYKPNKKTLFAVRRQFQIISKLLAAIDEHFNFLYEELSRFQEEGIDDDSHPLNAENLPRVLAELGLRCAQKEIDGLLKVLVSRGVKNVGSLRSLRNSKHLDIISNTYQVVEGRPPGNFEVVVNLANLVGCNDEKEQIERVKAQIESLQIWLGIINPPGT